MATTKLYLDTRTATGGLSPVKLTITHNGKSTHISLGVRIAASQWDKKGCKVVAHPNKTAYNSMLMQRKLDADNAIMRYVEKNGARGLSVIDFKRIILSEGAEDETPGMALLFMSRFALFIETKQGRTREIYEATYNKLRSYNNNVEALRFEDITKDWLTRFDNYMAETCARNTRNIHLRNIRAVFNDAIDNEVTTSYPFRRFKIRAEATAKRSLTVEQLRTLFSLRVENYAVRYLDYFKLSFFLCGINIADMCHLTTVTSGRVDYRRAKTHRLYSVKVEPEAMEIIERYRGKEWLLDIMDTVKDYRTFTKYFDRALKLMGEVEVSGRGGKKRRAPLFPSLSSYWARHSWATVAASLDIPKETIAAALGHGGTTVTDIYIDFDRRKVDEANRRVIDWVLYGKK